MLSANAPKPILARLFCHALILRYYSIDILTRIKASSPQSVYSSQLSSYGYSPSLYPASTLKWDMSPMPSFL